MKNRKFIIISSIDWATHWQMHHQLATSIVDAGHRVLFVENTGVRSPQIKDIGRIIDRIRNRFRSLHGFRQINDKLCIYSPAFIPFPYSKITNHFNLLFVSAAIKRWMRAAQFSDPIVISFLPTPLTQGLINEINPKLSVYYCANDMAGASTATAPLRLWEDRFFANADLVFTISGAISDRAKPFSRSIYSFPAGVDSKKFNPLDVSITLPADVKDINKPVVGYIGAISDVFDKALIVELAKALPHATVLLVGPKYTNTSILENCPNIVMLGERPHDQMPNYINSFDVALIPYVVNEFTDSVYSCKLNEYLAMGRPVISTNMREVRAFSEGSPDVVTIGNDTMDFIAKVKQALDDPQIQSQSMRNKRIAVAKENTWDQRFAGIMEVIDKHLLLKSQESVGWKKSLIKYYGSSRTRWLIRTAIVVCLYLLIFHTPLVWFAGDQLVVKHAPQRADAIVVFSGAGQSTSTRLNSSYQSRALDAAHFYNQGYAPSIFISSGRAQTISEVEMIRLYLVDKGVPLSAIHILDKYPNSTYRNVLMVGQMLKSQGARSILFLTSPYNGRRALWLWRKHAPDIVILAPAVVDTPPSNPQWSNTVDQIKEITYEYAAIAYNCLRGWL